MKKLIPILVFVLMVVPSCKRKAIEQLNREKQELSRVANERDSIINELSSSIEQFESTLGMAGTKGDLKDRMLSSLEQLKNLMNENDRRQRALRQMVSGSQREKERLKTEIDSLGRLINDKESQITALNREITGFKTQVDTQQLRINRLVSMNIDQHDKIEAITDQLNAGHFIVGEPKELLEKDITVKRGGFLGLFGQVKKLNPQFNPEEFKEVDIFSDTLIELPGEKFNIVTVHPQGTYNILDTNNMKQLEIIDPEKFWEASRYLVVENH